MDTPKFSSSKVSIAALSPVSQSEGLISFDVSGNCCVIGCCALTSNVQPCLVIGMMRMGEGGDDVQGEDDAHRGG